MPLGGVNSFLTGGFLTGATFANSAGFRTRRDGDGSLFLHRFIRQWKATAELPRFGCGQPALFPFDQQQECSGLHGDVAAD